MQTIHPDSIAGSFDERRSSSLHGLAASARIAVGTVTAAFSTATAWVWEATPTSTAPLMPHPDGHVTTTEYRSPRSFRR